MEIIAFWLEVFFSGFGSPKLIIAHNAFINSLKDESKNNILISLQSSLKIQKQMCLVERTVQIIKQYI